MVDLNQMIAFARVVVRGSFAAAAKDFGVPPSTLSRRVAALERRLGVVLLSRTTRSLRLTDAGREYFETCAAIVRNAEQADEAVMSLARAPRGTLRVTTPAVFVRSLALPTLAEYLRRYPNVRVEVTAEDRTVDLVREGYDLAFRVAASLPDTSLVARKIGSSSHVLCASPRYLARHGVPRHPRDLAEHVVCAFGRDKKAVSWSFWQKDKVVERLKLTPKVLTSSEDCLHAFAVEGIGVALTPPAMGAADFEAGRLERLFSRYEIERRNIYVVMPGEKQNSPVLRAYLDIVEAFVRANPSIFGS